jgi:xanthine dehydrogenase accessory factor
LADDTTLWQFITDALLKHRCSVMLLLVVSSQGSTPAKVGAKLAVTATQSVGTIGGGAIEHSLVKKARSLLLAQDFRWQLSQHQHNPHHADASGMICGGTQTVLCYACRLDELELYQQLANGKPALLSLSAAGMAVDLEYPAYCPPYLASSTDTWLYQETINCNKQAYIIGGGHVSLALSRILATLDFEITVIEQREQIDSFNNNSYADHKHILPYHQLHEFIPDGDRVFVFIMTHNHKTDALALAQLFSKPIAYLGLLGSQQKIAQLLKPYSNTPQLHAPMGLAIHSHTPAEIAISIAAELIQLANQS